ncbi:hypothetical protein MHYP_G00227730 [Metynnis hypsauchen]
MLQAYLTADSLGQAILQVKDSSPFYVALYSGVIQDAVREFGFTETDTKVAVEMSYKEMDDRDDIRSSISSVLPDLPGSILNIMEETLQSLGVGTIDDFQFVQEADLLYVLQPIQARKLLASWKQTSQGPGIQSQPDVNPSTSSSLLTSPTSSRSSLSPCPSPRI